MSKDKENSFESNIQKLENIIDKLEYTIRNEFKGALPVYRGNKAPAGTTYLQLNPVGSELLEYNVTSETREFTIQILYYF